MHQIVTFAQTPGIPATATGTVTGATTANLSWAAGSPPGSSTVTYYWAVGTSSSVTYESGYTKRGSTTNMSASVTGLTAGTKYYLSVKAKTDCDDTESGYKTSSSFTTDDSCIPPDIVTHPSNKTVTAPAGTTFSITASGSDNIYKWEMSEGFTWHSIPNGAPYSGIDSRTLDISSTTVSMDGYEYRCVVTTTCNSSFIRSQGARLTVSSGGTCNLSLSQSNLDFTSSSGSNTVDVTSNSSWSVSDDATWITVSPTSGSNNGTLIISVSENSGNGRSGIVTIIAECNTTKTINVTQSGTCSLSLSSTTLEYNYLSGLQNVNITSNSNWTITKDASWITVLPTSGNNNRTISVSVAYNNGGDRSGIVTVSGCGTTKTINVTQSGQCSLSISATSLEYSGSAETKTILVTSNAAWTVSDNASWITVTPLSDSNNGTLSISVLANDTGTERNGAVTVSGCSTSKKITINQKPICTPPVSPTGITASKTTIESGESVTLQVSGGVLNDAPNWVWYKGGCSGPQIGSGSTITVSPTETTTYYVKASACNYTTTCRSVQIKVDKICTLTVLQDTLHIASISGSSSFTVYSNATWEVSDKPDWVNLSVTNGTGNRTGTLTANDNVGSLRTGYIRLTGLKDCTREKIFVVNQEGKTTGIGDVIISGKVKIYPNPTTGIITIEGLPENENVEIAVYDINRKLIKHETSATTVTKINISDLVSGTYVIVINNQFEQPFKIIKE